MEGGGSGSGKAEGDNADSVMSSVDGDGQSSEKDKPSRPQSASKLRKSHFYERYAILLYVYIF